MQIKGLQASVRRISDLYASAHAIDRAKGAPGDWALLKLQEELGELTAEHLRISARARGAADPVKLADEAADVLGMLLIYCEAADIDIEEAMRRKWLRWLEPEPPAPER